MHLLVIAMTLALIAGPLAAQGSGAFLFSYQPHDGSRTAFDEGYAAHLEWHRANRDSLTWLAWDVMAGPRMGQFIDGIFGVSFAAIDERVDPAGDARDAAMNVEPHARPTAREMLRLRRDLSTGPLLEEGRPAPLVEVLRYSACASCGPHLEQAFDRLHDDAAGRQIARYAVYETVAGETPGFLLMVWRDRFASFDDVEADPGRLLGRHLAALAPGAGITVSSEIWRYRADLAYSPAER